LPKSVRLGSRIDRLYGAERGSGRNLSTLRYAVRKAAASGSRARSCRAVRRAVSRGSGGGNSASKSVIRPCDCHTPAGQRAAIVTATGRRLAGFDLVATLPARVRG